MACGVGARQAIPGQTMKPRLSPVSVSPRKSSRGSAPAGRRLHLKMYGEWVSKALEGKLHFSRAKPVPDGWYQHHHAACLDRIHMAAGRLHIINPKVVEYSAGETARSLESEAAVRELEFQALMWQLDWIDPSYQH